MNSRSNTLPGFASSAASISFMMPFITARSPLIRTGSQMSVSFVPWLSSIFAANFSGFRYSCGLGLTTLVRPGSRSGLMDTMVAPFFFARSSAVIMRG